MSAPANVPQPTELTRPFWSAAREHRLSIQRCKECQRHVFYPRPLCPHCGADALEWVDASGRGAIYSYTVARRPTSRAFAERVPYVIAIVELDEGPHMTTNIVECDPESLRVGDRVEAIFEDVSDEVALVQFRPARG